MSVGEDVEELEASLLEGRENGTAAQKVKHRTTTGSSNSAPGYIAIRTESRVLKKYLYTHVSICIIHNS